MYPVFVLFAVTFGAFFYIFEVALKKKIHFYDKIEKSFYAIVIALLILYINDIIYTGAYIINA